MIYRTRLKARVTELTSRMVVVRVQMARYRQRMPGYQFGMAWRKASDEVNPALGIRVALKRAIAACSFDPESPDARLLIRTAVKGLLLDPYRDAKLTLYASTKDL